MKSEVLTIMSFFFTKKKIIDHQGENKKKNLISQNCFPKDLNKALCLIWQKKLCLKRAKAFAKMCVYTDSYDSLSKNVFQWAGTLFITQKAQVQITDLTYALSWNVC